MTARALQAGVAVVMSLLAASACHSPAGNQDEAVSALVGTYTHPHRVWVFHGTEPVEVDVEDRLDLAAEGSSSVRFGLDVFLLDGTSCRLEGSADYRHGVLSYIEPAADPACELRFEPDETHLFVTDVESLCGTKHCGRTDAIGRLAFTRSDPAITD